MARLRLNTVLMPVAWEQVEPKEGAFDFSILDHWIDVARHERLHLVLLWDGAEWKVTARLNGDQSNQGRQLSMNPRQIRTGRVGLYSAEKP